MFTNTLLLQTLNDWSDVYMRHSFNEFKQFMDLNGLSPSQVITLFRIYHSGSCGVTAISKPLGITNPAASQLIERLVLMGFIERVEDPDDRRARKLTLTNKGRGIIEEGIAARRRWMERLITQLTPEQQATVIAALAVLTSTALNIGDEPDNANTLEIV